MASVIDNKYKMWELVYLKTDPNQFVRMVTGIEVLPGNVRYLLSVGPQVTPHYAQEISREENTALLERYLNS